MSGEKRIMIRTVKYYVIIQQNRFDGKPHKQGV